MAFIIRSFSFVLGFLPYSTQWKIAGFLAYLWWDVFAFRRFTLYRNITIAFPEKSREEKKRILKESLQHLAFNFIETMQLPRYDQKYLDERVVFEGLENYAKARGQNKGVFFLSLHLGNGDLAATVISLKGIPLHLITKRFKNKKLDKVWFGLRAEQGTHFIDAHGRENAFQILKALKQKESVVFVLDQFMGRPYGVETKFFGKKTGTAYGLSLFAAKTGAPVIPVYSYRDKDLRFHVAFGEEIPFVPNENKDLQTQEMTQRYSDVLETLIRQHPEQWMWVHRRWKLYE